MINDAWMNIYTGRNSNLKVSLSVVISMYTNKIVQEIYLNILLIKLKQNQYYMHFKISCLIKHNKHRRRLNKKHFAKQENKNCS